MTKEASCEGEKSSPGILQKKEKKRQKEKEWNGRGGERHAKDQRRPEIHLSISDTTVHDRGLSFHTTQQLMGNSHSVESRDTGLRTEDEKRSQFDRIIHSSSFMPSCITGFSSKSSITTLD